MKHVLKQKAAPIFLILAIVLALTACSGGGGNSGEITGGEITGGEITGGDNTFTDLNNLRTALQAKDLFGAGDVFTAERYSEFLINGRMDDGSRFGYTVEIVSIGTDPAGEATATIRITAN